MAYADVRVMKRITPKRSVMAALLLIVVGLSWSHNLSAQPDSDASGVEASLPIQSSLSARLDGAAYQDTKTASYHQTHSATAVFYAERGHEPLWTGARVQRFASALDTLEDDGLRPDDYQQAQWRQLASKISANQTVHPDDEIRLTTSYLRALFHLARGKVNEEGTAPQWNFTLPQLTSAVSTQEITRSIERSEFNVLFDQVRPRHESYRNLKAGLARYRDIVTKGGWPTLAPADALKPCTSHPQVSQLRERLRVSGDYDATSTDFTRVCGAEGAGDNYYDDRLLESVKRFQRDQYLEDDGVVGPTTRTALNVSAQQRLDQIRVNLDRSRGMLQTLPDTMVLVDVAGYKVTYFKGGEPVWNSRVQVGMSYRTSPIFQSEVSHITFNPTWTVPPTILKKDVIPKVRKDIGYLNRSKIRVYNSAGNRIDPHSVNWSNPSGITLRQDAGPHSALGKAVIRFPNSHAVYLHDTPHQALFNKTQRAFSSGCIRVERALELVELLLEETPDWGKSAIDKAVASGKTRNVNLAQRVPIFLSYWTVDVFSENRLAFKPDIYNRDAKALAALNRAN